MSTAAPPLVSVIVAAHRRPEPLARCLAALAQQTLPREAFEVVVCDDGSPEPLAPEAARVAEVLALRLLRQEHAGPAAARNTAARAARGSLLAFTDDDCCPAPEWVARLTEHHARAPEALLGGRTENALPADRYAAATQLIVTYAYGYRDRQTGLRRFDANNLAVPAGRFHQLGGFSETFPRPAGEDHDFCARWHAAGWPTVYARDAVVWHAHAHHAVSFWRQHFGYGRALLRVHQRRARRERQPLRFEAPRFYAGLLAAPLRGGRGVQRWRMATLVLLAQTATAAGAAREALAGRGDLRE